jgi:hypothetical protein
VDDPEGEGGKSQKSRLSCDHWRRTLAFVMTRKIDLLGLVQGELTVIGYAEPIKKRAAWLCRCSCGDELVITQVRLVKSVRHCGDRERHPYHREPGGRR